MAAQTIDYDALEEQARKAAAAPGTIPQGTTGSGVDIDYDALEKQARTLQQFDNPANRYVYTTPQGIPVYQAAPSLPAGETPPSPQEPTLPATVLNETLVNPAKQVGSGLMSGVAGATHLTANIAGLLDVAAGKIADLTGLEKGGIFKHIEDWAREQQQAQEKQAAELSGGRHDLPSQLFRSSAEALTSLPTYAAAGAAAGPVGGMAILGGLETAGQGWKNQLQAAAMGALTGVALNVMGPAGRPIRMTGTAVMTYAQLRLSGVDHETALAQALTMGGMAGPGEPGLRVNKFNRIGAPGLGEIVTNLPLPKFAKVKNVLNPVEQANQQFLTERGVETPLSMQTGSKAAANIEGIVQNIPGGGGFTERMEASKEKLKTDVAPDIFQELHPEPVTSEEAGAGVQQTLGRNLERTRSGLAEEVLPGRPMTPEAAGSAVLERGKQEIERYHAQANDSYDAAWKAERDPRNIRDVQKYDDKGKPVLDDKGNPVTEKMALPIDMSDVQRALKPIADQYERTLTPTDRHASVGLLAMRNIINDPPVKPARAAEIDLGMLKDAARTEKGLAELRDTSQGLAAASVKELQAKIDETLAKAHYPGWDPSSGTPSPALKYLQEGRRNTAEKHKIADVFRPFGPNIEKVEPVAAYQRMTWAGDAGIQHLRQMADIAPEQMPMVGRAFIDGGGNWESLGPKTKEILFKDPGIIESLESYYAKEKKFGPLIKLEPVALFDRVTAPGGKRINLLEDIAAETPEHKAQIARAFVQGLFDRATREGDIQKVQSTLDKWMDLDDKTKAILIEDPAQVRNLNNLFMALKRLMKNPNPSGSGYIMALNKIKGNVFQNLFSIMGGTAGGAAGGVPGALAGAAGGAALEYGGNAALARLLFNKRFINMLTRGMREELSGNKAGAGLAARTLKGIIDEEPPLGGPAEPPEGSAGPRN